MSKTFTKQTIAFFVFSALFFVTYCGVKKPPIGEKSLHSPHVKWDQTESNSTDKTQKEEKQQ